MNKKTVHHPHTSMLLEFSAGTLDIAESICVSAHLHFCAHCRDSLHRLDQVGSKLMANELSKYKIRVNSIAPNITDTDMSEQMDINSANNLLEKSFLKRKCTVNEISDLVIFLSSNKSSYINGQILRIDGGMSG